MNSNLAEGSLGLRPAPSSKTISQALSAAQAICRQLIRFQKMSHSERASYFRRNPLDALCMIDHPGGRGSLICGALAYKKFARLAELVTEFQPELAHRTSRAQLKGIVIDLFVQCILKESHEVDRPTMEKLLVDAANKARQSLQITEHYLPCVLFLRGGPDEFEIGPVTFTRRAAFFRKHKQALKCNVVRSVSAHVAHVEKAIANGFPHERAVTPEQSARFIRGLHARAIKTYRNYPWIATVRLVNCDQATSEERAAKVVEVALHVIRIFLGADHTKRLRLAWSRGDALRMAGMWADADNMIHMSVSSSSIGPVGGENWYEGLTQDGGQNLRSFGSALFPLADPIKPSNLHERFIDAINWFGDAATSHELSASVVKYVSAIERLLFGKYHPRRHKEMFAIRITHVFRAFSCEDKQTYEKAKGIYDARSKLLHGSSSPRNLQITEQVAVAEELARLCILCAAQLYQMMLEAYNDQTPDELEGIMDKIRKSGIDWLVRDATAARQSQ